MNRPATKGDLDVLTGEIRSFQPGIRALVSGLAVEIGREFSRADQRADGRQARNDHRFSLLTRLVEDSLVPRAEG